MCMYVSHCDMRVLRRFCFFSTGGSLSRVELRGDQGGTDTACMGVAGPEILGLLNALTGELTARKTSVILGDRTWSPSLDSEA